MSIFTHTSEAESERADGWRDQSVDREREREDVALADALLALADGKPDEAVKVLIAEFDCDTSRFEIGRILNLVQMGMHKEAMDAIHRRMLL